MMTAEVSSVMRSLNRHSEEEGSGSNDVLITRDLLGCPMLGTTELGIDLQILNRCDQLPDGKSEENVIKQQEFSHFSEWKQSQNCHQRQDLNFPPPLSFSVLEDPLDLKLVPSNEYQSVCTLEKVKSALERVDRVLSSSSSSRKRRFPCDISSSSSSTREMQSETTSEKMFASGCPGCLLYVLISQANPRCPRCDTVVPFPTMKKTKIDLNTSV